MFNIAAYALGTILLGAFVYLDGHKITKNVLTVKYHKFKKVNRLVSTNYKGFFKILFVSVWLITKALWINLLQYLNSTIVHIGGNKYLVKYIIKGKTYKMIVKLRRGPKRVMMVSDKNQEDVSHLIIPYLGPEEDFHGKTYTPTFFKKDELVFEMSNGSELIFGKSDSINLDV